MKKRIADMSLEEEQNEMVFSIIERFLKRAKEAATKAQAAEYSLFKALDDMCIDPNNVPTSAENADNLHEAICCFLQYDEYSLSGIMKEIRSAYGMGEVDDDN